jgi:hypothetical protein
MNNKKSICIIGNGFDLHHWNEKKPNTSYEAFGLFLQKNEPKIHDLFSNFFPLEGNWNHFEISLSEIDMEQFSDFVMEEIGNYLDDSDPHRFGEASWEAKKYIELLTTKMREALHAFIHGESYQLGGIQYPQNINDIQINLPKNALYLSFNYTNTLERYYGIPESRICYLHGKSGRGEELIIGHGVDPTTLENSEPSPVMPDNLSPEEQEMWYDQAGDQDSPSYDLAKGEVEQYWNKSFKNTQSIIKSNASFFQQYERLDKVVIMGHSLSEVDLPYFKEIKKRVSPDAYWDISFHTNDEENYLKNTVLRLGVPRNQINMFKLGDILYSHSPVSTHYSLAKV